MIPDWEGLMEDIRTALLRDKIYSKIKYIYEEREELEEGEGNVVCFMFTGVNRGGFVKEISVETAQPTEVFPVWERDEEDDSWMFVYDLMLGEEE